MSLINRFPIIVFCITAITVSFTGYCHASEQHHEQSKMAIMLTGKDTTVNGMALTMAYRMVTQMHADVTIILAGESLSIAVKDTDSPVFTATQKTLHQTLNDLSSADVPIYICAMCLYAQKLKQSDIIDGIMVANNQIILPLLLDPSIKVLTF